MIRFTRIDVQYQSGTVDVWDNDIDPDQPWRWWSYQGGAQRAHATGVAPDKRQARRAAKRSLRQPALAV